VTKKNNNRDRDFGRLNATLKGESISGESQRHYNRSRPWVYKWVERYEASSARNRLAGRTDQSADNNSRQLSKEVVERENWPACIFTIRGCFVARSGSVGTGGFGPSAIPSLRTINRIIAGKD